MELRTDLVLTVLTSNMNPQINFKFQNCFPLNLSSISFDSSNTDVEYITQMCLFVMICIKLKTLKNDKSFEGPPVNRNSSRGDLKLEEIQELWNRDREIDISELSNRVNSYPTNS